MTIILAIETTTQACSAALLVNDQVHEQFEIAPRRHTDLILPMIESLCHEHTVDKAMIDAIAYSQGPGSFMGTRLSIAVAQALGYAWQCPLIPVSTLQILAQTAYQDLNLTDVIAAWDARMNEIYCGAYRLEDGIMNPVIDDYLVKPQHCDLQATNKTLVGNAWTVYRDAFDPAIIEACEAIEPEIYPHAGSLITLALNAFKQGAVVDALHAEPVYLRNKVTS